VAITRDGSLIAYGTPSEDLSAPGGRLYLRSLDGVTRPVSELVPAFTPAFSPDGDRLVFRVGSTRYYVTSVKGGAPVLAVEPIVGAVSTPAWWGQDGLLYENYGTLYRKTLAGTPEVFAKPDEAKRETYYYGASATPDGAWLSSGPLRTGIRTFGREGIFAIGNAAAEAHPIVAEGISIAIQSAALLCGQLVARPELRRAGIDPTRILEQVRHDYALAWRSNFAPRLFVAAALAHLFMRPASTRIATTLLQRFPKLLTEGARWSGKTTPLRAARPFDLARS
jgi:hypothetical protein